MTFILSSGYPWVHVLLFSLYVACWFHHTILCCCSMLMRHQVYHTWTYTYVLLGMSCYYSLQQYQSWKNAQRLINKYAWNATILLVCHNSLNQIQCFFARLVNCEITLPGCKYLWEWNERVQCMFVFCKELCNTITYHINQIEAVIIIIPSVSWADYYKFSISVVETFEFWNIMMSHL